MKISAIICTYNRASYLKRAVQSLLNQSLGKNDYEIIVVDNASTDHTANFIKSNPSIRYIYEPVLKLSQARNTGWKNAMGKYVAYLDDDAVASYDWLKNIIDAFENIKPTPGVVGGKVYLDWETDRPKWLPEGSKYLGYFAYINWGDSGHFLKDNEYLAGANIAYSKELLSEIGGFSLKLGRKGKKLYSMEELYTNYMLKEKGYRIYYSPKIVVDHIVTKERHKKSWLLKRAYCNELSKAIMHIERYHISFRKRLILSVRIFKWIILHLKNIFSSFSSSDDPVVFEEKILWHKKLGYMIGLLKGERGATMVAMSENLPIRNAGESKVIIGEELGKAEEAIYNPGSIICDGEIRLLANYRKYPWGKVLYNDCYFNSTVPKLLILDSNLKLKKSKDLSVVNHNFTEAYRIEDFRLFRFKNKIYINYDISFQDFKNSRSRKDVQALAELDGDKMIFLGFPKLDFRINSYEKNWAYFANNDELYLLYSFAPYRLLRLHDWQNLEFTTIISKDIDITLPTNSKIFKLFLSTNPIEYDKENYLVLCHTTLGSRPERIYSHWAALIDKKSLVPVSICQRPIIDGPGIRGEHKSIVYVMSAAIIGDEVIIFMGEGDTCSTYTRISKKELDLYFAPIS